MRLRAVAQLSALAVCLSWGAYGQSADANGQAAEIQRLKAQLAAQQEQLNRLERLIAAQQAAPEHKMPNLGEVASTTPMVPSGGAPAAQQNVVAGSAPPGSPLQIHLGDATITPIGFMDLTNTFRSTNSGNSLATNFGSIPYNNTAQGRLTEDRLSSQNSRLGLRVDAKVHGANVLGYMEGDFVGFVPTNSQVTSNSMTYRLRLYWINLRKGIWEMQAGQSWSLLTPNRNGLSALPGDLFYSQVVDVNYMNGLAWGRIPGIRFIVHPNKVVSAGISLESPEQYIGGSGGGGVVTLPAAFSGNNYFNEANNGTTTTSVPNVHPDIIAKIAFDTKMGGRGLHFEVAGIERTFKTFNPTTQQYFTKIGGGGSANLNWEVVKNFRLVTNNYYSDGGGRYLFGVAPDMVIRADGSPSLIHSASTVSGFEAQVKNSLIYAYYGGVYIGRNTARDVNGAAIGYGFTGSSNAQNRTTQEGTIGLTQTLWRDAKYGAVQFMLQYAYFFRDPWFVAANAPKNAHEHAAWFNFRYVLPGSAPAIQR